MPHQGIASRSGQTTRQHHAPSCTECLPIYAECAGRQCKLLVHGLHKELLMASYISWQCLFPGGSVTHGGPAQQPLASLPLTGIQCDLQAVLAITGGSASDPMLFQSVMIEQLADQSRVLKVSLLTCAAAPQSCCASMLCSASLLGAVCHIVAGIGRLSLNFLY